MKTANDQIPNPKIPPLPFPPKSGLSNSTSNLLPLIDLSKIKKNDDNDQNISFERKTDEKNSNTTKEILNKPPPLPTAKPGLMPRLNLSNIPRQAQSVGLTRSETVSSASVPALNIASLNLTGLPPHSAQNEQHLIYICVPLNKSKDQKTVINNKMRNFEQNNQIIEVDNNIVIEGDDSSDAIPTIQALDLAWQNLNHLPALINQTTAECVSVTTHIEKTLANIAAMRDMKEALKIEIALAKERIKVANEEMEKFSDYRHKLKNDFDVFISKVSKH